MKNFKTKLVGPDGTITFDASISLPESRSAVYDQYALVHMPVDLYAYKNTTSRTFGIRSKLVSRNSKEANKNIRYLDMVRRWILPSFGKDGAPPPILRLTSYDNGNIGGGKDGEGLTCIMKSYNWEFPEDVDYIFAGNGLDSPMPIIGHLNIDLTEIYSANDILAGKWNIKLNGAGNPSTNAINEDSRSKIYKFNSSSQSPSFIGGTSNITEVFNQIPSIAKNIFVGGVGNKIAGELTRAGRNIGITIPNSGQAGARLSNTIINGFGRAISNLTSSDPTDV